MRLEDKGNAHFIAKLEVRPPYKEHSTSIGFVGFKIEPVFGEAYRVGKPKELKQQYAVVKAEEYDEIPF